MWSRRSSIIVLISGNGSNLQAIIDDIKRKEINAYISCVISNNEEAFGIVRAQESNIPSYIINHTDYKSREDFVDALQKKIDEFSPDLIVLAGFMRILSQNFVKTYLGKLINIHPSILPKYPGLNTHERVIKDGSNEHGVTVHYVNEDLDGGPICAKSLLKVNTTSEAELKNQINKLEYKLYPAVIKWITNGEMQMKGSKVLMNNINIGSQGITFEDFR